MGTDKLSYVGKVLKDGHLSLSRAVKKELQLRPGDEVVVSVNKTGENPLQRLIGLGGKGRTDGAAHHDRYLYGEDS